MRLSEAIRLGAMMKPQAFDQWTLDGSCALAAACEASGLARIQFVNGSRGLPYAALYEAFPVLSESVKPAIGSQTRELMSTIWSLNDVHEWSRERIADYVEQIENEQSAKRLEIDALPLTEQVGQ